MCFFCIWRQTGSTVTGCLGKNTVSLSHMKGKDIYEAVYAWEPLANLNVTHQSESQISETELDSSAFYRNSILPMLSYLQK